MQIIQKTTFLTLIMLQFFLAASFAQNFKKIGVSVKPEKNWKNSSEPKDETDTKFRLVAQGKSAMMEVYNLGKVNSETATIKSIDILKERKHDPKDVETATQRKEKIGKNQFAIFEGTVKTPLETQNKTFVQWWALYLCEIGGKKVVIYATEYYLEEDKKLTAKEEVERMLKTIK